MDVILKNNFFFDKETKVLEDKLTTDFVVACKSSGVCFTLTLQNLKMIITLMYG